MTESPATFDIPPRPKGDYFVAADQTVPMWIVNEAYLINEGLEKGRVSLIEAKSGLSTETEIARLMCDLVEVTYFVELPPETVPPEERGQRLQRLFDQPMTDQTDHAETLAAHLRERGQAVSLAMSTLDSGTAEAVRSLNEHDVPVVGWVVVDDAEGYWTNKTNIGATMRRTGEVLHFAEKHGLMLAGLGFDLERPIKYLKAVMNLDARGICRQVRDYRSALSAAKADGDPQTRFNEFVTALRRDGQSVETYVMPRFTKQILGDLKPPEGVKTIDMVYTSTLPARQSEHPLARRLYKGGWAARTLLSKGAVPGLGLLTGIEGETPGRDLTGNGVVPPHHDRASLAAELKAVIRPDVAARDMAQREIYIFALNHPRVVATTEGALDDAFAITQRSSGGSPKE